ncbi:Myb/SANT-like transcription factor, partial [Oryctes borbonicus]
MSKWTKRTALELIAGYKRKPFLWNKDHKDYRCRERRSKAMVQLAATFEVEPKHVKKKIETLIRTYRSHLHAVMKITKELGQTDYESTWFAYKALDSFLHRKYAREISTAEYDAPATSGATKKNDNGATTENDNDATTENDNYATTDNDSGATTDNDEVQIVDNDEIEQVYKIEDSSDDEINPKEDILITSTDIIKQETNTVTEYPLAEHQEVDDCEPTIKRPKLAEATSQSRPRTYADVRKRDDCDLFGKYVSGTMREFDRKTRCVVQYLVSNILCQADLGAFQDGSFDWQGLVGFQ